MIFIMIALAAAEPALDCNNQITQVDLNQCAYAEYQRVDAELNRHWKLAIAGARKSDREMPNRRSGTKSFLQSLMAAQRAWLVYRDNHCVLNSYAIGGSMEPMLHSLCLTNLTEVRIAQLVKIAEGQ